MCMKIDIKNLPSGDAILHQIIINLWSVNESLREQLALLRAKQFGKSSEKLDRQISELELRIEENESLVAPIMVNADADISEAEGDESGKRHPRRMKLPDNLSRTDVVLAPDPVCPSCGGEEFRKISDDISEALEYVPCSFKVNRYIRPRCACINCEAIVQAYTSSRAIDKGKAESGLLAHILVQKYCNHLPLYRQSQMYEREGIELSRSTMASWVGQCSKLLEPLIEELKKSIFTADHIHGDDTTVKVLAPGLGKTKTGRLWTYVRDGRPHGDTTTPPAVCYFYSPDRKGERPREHLKDYKGVLHADAYSGYDELYVKKGKDKSEVSSIREAACWAHTRRKFYEVVVANDKASIANAILEKISEIYSIESKIKGFAPGERLKHRQEKSKELVQNLFLSFKKYYGQLPKKSSTGKAIAYAMNNQAALMRFLEDGMIEIDNNAAERAMRSIAVGRKNWLFAGSDNGGRSAAAIYSLIETAKLNNINPWKYLQKVLDTIQDHSSHKIAELLPWNIKLE